MFVEKQASTLSFNDCVLLRRTAIINSDCRLFVFVVGRSSGCKDQRKSCFVSDLTMIGNSKLEFYSEINFP